MPSRCTATRADGKPCRAYAVRNTDPPRCAAHGGAAHAGAPARNQNRRSHGFYSRQFTPDELADLVTYADNMTLSDEIACARVALRRILNALHTNGNDNGLPTDEYARLAALCFQGTRTVARLLRDQRAISGQAADGIAGAIATALDELSSEWGITL